MINLITTLFPLRAGDPDQPRGYLGRHRHPATWYLPRRGRPLR